MQKVLVLLAGLAVERENGASAELFVQLPQLGVPLRQLPGLRALNVFQPAPQLFLETDDLTQTLPPAGIAPSRTASLL